MVTIDTTSTYPTGPPGIPIELHLHVNNRIVMSDNSPASGNFPLKGDDVLVKSVRATVAKRFIKAKCWRLVGDVTYCLIA